MFSNIALKVNTAGKKVEVLNNFTFLCLIYYYLLKITAYTYEINFKMKY